jgi:hypothetical protein
MSIQFVLLDTYQQNLLSYSVLPTLAKSGEEALQYYAEYKTILTW